MYHDWDWTEAEREFRTAIELNPGYSTGHQWYGNFMAVMGRRDECVAEFERAVALDPLSGLKIAAVGWGYYFGRRWDESIAQSTRALELDPTLAVAHWWMGLALGQIGQFDRAIAEFEEGSPPLQPEFGGPRDAGELPGTVRPACRRSRDPERAVRDRAGAIRLVL